MKMISQTSESCLLTSIAFARYIRGASPVRYALMPELARCRYPSILEFTRISDSTACEARMKIRYIPIVDLDYSPHKQTDQIALPST
jgi:hypothetical protein